MEYDMEAQICTGGSHVTPMTSLIPTKHEKAVWLRKDAKSELQRIQERNNILHSSEDLPLLKIIHNPLRRSSESCFRNTTGQRGSEPFRNVVDTKWWIQLQQFNAIHSNSRRHFMKTALDLGQRRNDGVPLIECIYKILTTHNNKILICGLAGIGKTTVVTWFAHHYTENYEYIVWVDCSENNVSKSIRKLAKYLNIENWGNIAIEELAGQCYTKLSPFSCLFVYEDADLETGSAAQILLSTIQIKSSTMHSIITSRSGFFNNSLSASIHTISLDVFTKEQSIDFMRENLNVQLFYQNYISESKLTLLSESLGHYPLALQIAVATLNSVSSKSLEEDNDVVTKINEFIESIRNEYDWNILHSKFLLQCDFETTIFQVLKPTIESIKKGHLGRLAHRIMMILGYLQKDDVEIGFIQTVVRKSIEEVCDAIDLLRKYFLCSQTVAKRDNELKREATTVSVHPLLQKLMRFINGKYEEGCILRKILKANGNLKYKLHPYLIVEKRNHKILKVQFSSVKNQLVDKICLTDLISEKRFQDAVYLAKLICHTLRQRKKDLYMKALKSISSTLRQSLQHGLIRAHYNYTLCLEIHEEFEKALAETLLILSNNKYGTQLEIPRVVGSLQSTKVLDVPTLLIQVFRLHFKQNILMHSHQFQILEKLFTQKWGGGHRNLFLLCCSHFLENGCQPPIPSHPHTMQEWIYFAEFIDDLEIEMTKLDKMAAMYEYASSIMPFTQWNFKSELKEIMKAFGRNALAFFQPHKTKQIPIRLLNAVNSIRRRLFGVDDVIYQQINTFIQNNELTGDYVSLIEHGERQRLSYITELHWKGGQSLESEFTHRLTLNMTQLTKISLSGHSVENPSIIFRNDLIYSLQSSFHLQTLILNQIELVGEGTAQVHLPNIDHFFLDWNSCLNMKRVQDINVYRFFYKEWQCIWKDISTMQEFHLENRIHAAKSTKSVHFANLELTGIDFAYFTNVEIDYCVMVTTKECKCEFCTENSPSNDNTDFSNVKKLCIRYSAFEGKSFDLTRFNSISNLTLYNIRMQDLEFLIEYDYLRNIKFVDLHGVNVSCEDRVQLLKENWKLEDVHTLDSYSNDGYHNREIVHWHRKPTQSLKGRRTSQTYLSSLMAPRKVEPYLCEQSEELSNTDSSGYFSGIVHSTDAVVAVRAEFENTKENREEKFSETQNDVEIVGSDIRICDMEMQVHQWLTRLSIRNGCATKSELAHTLAKCRNLEVLEIIKFKIIDSKTERFRLPKIKRVNLNVHIEVGDLENVDSVDNYRYFYKTLDDWEDVFKIEHFVLRVSGILVIDVNRIERRLIFKLPESRNIPLNLFPNEMQIVSLKFCSIKDIKEMPKNMQRLELSGVHFNGVNEFLEMDPYISKNLCVLRLDCEFGTKLQVTLAKLSCVRIVSLKFCLVV